MYFQKNKIKMYITHQRRNNSQMGIHNNNTIYKEI